MAKAEESQDSSKVAVVILLSVVFFVIGFIILNTISNSKQDTVSLSKEASLIVANARLASSQNALDGKGEFKKDDCEKLKIIAKDFDSNSDFLESCESAESLYLGTPDTSERKVLTISDNNYTAKFTLDNELSVLYDYVFSDTPTAGFNTSGGRK